MLFANFPVDGLTGSCAGPEVALWEVWFRRVANLHRLPLTSFEAPPRQTTGGLPDGCSTAHPDNLLHFQLKQDSLGSTRSQAGRHR